VLHSTPLLSDKRCHPPFPIHPFRPNAAGSCWGGTEGVKGVVVSASPSSSPSVPVRQRPRSPRFHRSVIDCWHYGEGQKGLARRPLCCTAAPTASAKETVSAAVPQRQLLPRTLGCRLHGWHKYEYPFRIATPQIRVFSVLGFAAALSHYALPFRSFALLMAVFG
jgi:hypothetical protein